MSLTAYWVDDTVVNVGMGGLNFPFEAVFVLAVLPASNLVRASKRRIRRREEIVEG